MNVVVVLTFSFNRGMLNVGSTQSKAQVKFISRGSSLQSSTYVSIPDNEML